MQWVGGAGGAGEGVGGWGELQCAGRWGGGQGREGGGEALAHLVAGAVKGQLTAAIARQSAHIVGKPAADAEASCSRQQQRAVERQGYAQCMPELLQLLVCRDVVHHFHVILHKKQHNNTAVTVNMSVIAGQGRRRGKKGQDWRQGTEDRRGE